MSPPEPDSGAEPTGRPTYRSHFLPRTSEGWIASVSFVVLFLLAMPPVTHRVLDRVEPWILGFPFFYASLFVIYSALIGVLIWTYRKRI